MICSDSIGQQVFGQQGLMMTLHQREAEGNILQHSIAELEEPGFDLQAVSATGGGSTKHENSFEVY